MKNCLKCSQPYQTTDEEPYYCPSCLVEKQRIAAEVDARFPHKPDTRPANYDRFAPYDLRNVLGRK